MKSFFLYILFQVHGKKNVGKLMVVEVRPTSLLSTDKTMVTGALNFKKKTINNISS